MRSHRLSRLALLTQGVALVSFGFSGAACNDPTRVNAPKDDPHMNAPAPTPTPTVTASESPAPPADTGAPPTALPPPHMNAPAGTGTAQPSSSTQPPLPKPPSHTNAPPKR